MLHNVESKTFKICTDKARQIEQKSPFAIVALIIEVLVKKLFFVAVRHVADPLLYTSYVHGLAARNAFLNPF